MMCYYLYYKDRKMKQSQDIPNKNGEIIGSTASRGEYPRGAEDLGLAMEFFQHIPKIPEPPTLTDTNRIVNNMMNDHPVESASIVALGIAVCFLFKRFCGTRPPKKGEESNHKRYQVS